MKKALLVTSLPVSLESEAKKIFQELDRIHSDLNVFILDTFVSHLKTPARILEEHDRLKIESQKKISSSINLLKKMTKNRKYNVNLKPLSCMGSPEFVIPDIIKNHSMDFFIVSRSYLEKTGIKNGKPEILLKKTQISTPQPILF